mmetsp:Transcript_93824/g.268645  ORF Transcript_93824/g.268645 Transcript_93824/m.268645 type:complete len:461 (+) Transcript_93824:44-1426(+)
MRSGQVFTSLALVWAGSVRHAQCAYCSGTPDPNAPRNANPITDAVPAFIREVTNGKLYSVTQTGPNGNPGQTFAVTHVWGTPYEKGFAQGQLLQSEIQAFYNQTWAYLEEEISSSLPGLFFPDWFLEQLAGKTMAEALDWTAQATMPFTDSNYYDEMRGLSDGSGTSYDLLVRVHALPEATKGHCSMFGAWDDALDPSSKTELLQLRALDWDVDGPFKDYSAITVSHASKDGSGDPNSWANVGFMGFLGTITGVSDKQMAISEIGVTFPDDTFGKESRHGVPFSVLLRDILSQDPTIDAALQRITDANRTCDLILGVGDGKAVGGSNFRSIQYSASVANFITDTNLQPVNDTWHAPIGDVVYHGMDWLCPGYSEVLMAQLQKFHGTLTAANAISDVIAITSTGNLHIAVSDLTANEMYVSFAANSTNTDGDDFRYAYQRSFTKFDMGALFDEAAPVARPA